MATEVRGACPLDCPDICARIVTVKDGEAVALRGDRDHSARPGAESAISDREQLRTTAAT